VFGQNYPLSGVMFTHMCFCGGKWNSFENMSLLGRSPDCNIQCLRDSHEVCGGTNAMSVYLTDVNNYNVEREYPQELQC
jgi:hypothetical protein